MVVRSGFTVYVNPRLQPGCYSHVGSFGIKFSHKRTFFLRAPQVCMLQWHDLQDCLPLLYDYMKLLYDTPILSAENATPTTMTECTKGLIPNYLTKLLLFPQWIRGPVLRGLIDMQDQCIAWDCRRFSCYSHVCLLSSEFMKLCIASKYIIKVSEKNSWHNNW